MYLPPVLLALTIATDQTKPLSLQEERRPVGTRLDAIFKVSLRTPLRIRLQGWCMLPCHHMSCLHKAVRPYRK